MFVDSLVAGAYLVPTLIAGVLSMVFDPSWPTGVRLALAALAGASLFLRRQHPQTVFIIAMVFLVADVLLAHDIDFIPALIALYALAVYRSARAAWIGFAVFSLATAGVISLSVILVQTTRFDPLDSTPTPSIIFLVLVALFWVLIGNNVGGRRRYLLALIDRAQQLARERDQQAVIAAVAERSRIAREMHDIVSHSLTVMITLADGSAGLATSSPDRASDAMRLVAETGRSALDDMRRLLGVLRATEGDGAVREPQPGVGELGELVERFRAAGLPVRITVAGTPPTDTGQQLTIFRVVQEALTNALRYAALASVVEVTIQFTAQSITITVDDDAALHGAPGQGSGRGLLGLSERVGLYGGTLVAGPRSTGGWRLRAVFETIASRTIPPPIQERP
ncbi:sensor histidine kinase [Leifsonia poae]|uniref:sensor histidine kinase n=1 Tax=Leifsonia poae TaxID=110933 RepID=UPI001CC03FC9|nr:histidine kinase [Leifsonia poae]